jgi:hypothetical protein
LREEESRRRSEERLRVRMLRAVCTECGQSLPGGGVGGVDGDDDDDDDDDDGDESTETEAETEAEDEAEDEGSERRG